MLLILAVIIVLAMLRLGVWQLDRAEQKQAILTQVMARAAEPAVPLTSLLDEFGFKQEAQRFRQVTLRGRFLIEKSVFIDNQVVAGQVGYKVFTPLQITKNQTVVMIDRGWVSAGESRAKLPDFATAPGDVFLVGRLNTAPAQPPIWDKQYPVAQGSVWAYLPIGQYSEQMQLKVLPLVVELAPEATGRYLPDTQFKIRWADVSDEWVAKHQGYAFQWFAMAAAFFIACLAVLMRRRSVV